MIDTQVTSKCSPFIQVDLSEFIQESWTVLEPQLSTLLQSKMDGILSSVKEAGNESLAHELQTLTDKVKQIKNEPPAVKKQPPPTPIRSVPEPSDIPVKSPNPPPITSTPSNNNTTPGNPPSCKPIPPVKSKTEPSMPLQSQKQPPQPVAIEAPPKQEKEKSKPGFIKMLNHLTKSRPKVKRKDNKQPSAEQEEEEEYPQDVPQESIESIHDEPAYSLYYLMNNQIVLFNLVKRFSQIKRVFLQLIHKQQKNRNLDKKRMKKRKRKNPLWL